MNPGILVFTRDQNLLLDLGQHLDGKNPIVPCETLESLPSRLHAQPVGAVLVHLDRATLNGYSPARFMAEIDDAIDSAPLYGLLDQDCPPRLKKLAEKSIDDCLQLPLDFPRLRRLLADKQDLGAELAGFWNEMPHRELHGRSRSLVTFTPEMFEMLDEIKVAARHNVTALLIGETGSGKTFLARLIHEISDRREERFCTVACGALPPDLIESELFGYVKGAFTGADRDREGKFAAAGRGTLLLDEIDVLPPEQQAKLLRVIETGEYEPVGSNETQHSQARLIVASNYNLEELVRGGNFRTDLYYRLNILNFRLLALRERPLDIEYLARKFALEHSRTHSIALRTIEPEFLEMLRAYHWPGNIREMENVIRRAVLYCQRGVLSVGDLPSSLRSSVASQRALPEHLSNELPRGFESREHFVQHGQPGQHGPPHELREPESALPRDGEQPHPDSPAYTPSREAIRPGAGPLVNLSRPNRPLAAEGPLADLLPPAIGNRVGSSATRLHPFRQPMPLQTANHPPLYQSVDHNPSRAFESERGGTATLAAPPSAAVGTANLVGTASRSLEARVDVLERRIIEDCLQRNNFRRKETAAELGISRVTLYNKMKKFGLM
ncbi:MAG: sigma 54-interacting transcriptional regulator [Pirellulaceae bacterium]|jgi:DNA-binding NtrC family response regulator|nr:sigma 54-interacting transcriptional regulator [Pirellulaceae bacterium]